MDDECQICWECMLDTDPSNLMEQIGTNKGAHFACVEREYPDGNSDYVPYVIPTDHTRMIDEAILSLDGIQQLLIDCRGGRELETAKMAQARLRLLIDQMDGGSIK